MSLFHHTADRRPFLLFVFSSLLSPFWRSPRWLPVLRRRREESVTKVGPWVSEDSCAFSFSPFVTISSLGIVAISPRLVSRLWFKKRNLKWRALSCDGLVNNACSWGWVESFEALSVKCQRPPLSKHARYQCINMTYSWRPQNSTPYFKGNVSYCFHLTFSLCPVTVKYLKWKRTRWFFLTKSVKLVYFT